MTKYHLNPETGDPKPCSAKISCPYGDLEANHYPTPEAGRAAFEEIMAKEEAFAREESAANKRKDEEITALGEDLKVDGAFSYDGFVFKKDNNYDSYGNLTYEVKADLSNPYSDVQLETWKSSNDGGFKSNVYINGERYPLDANSYRAKEEDGFAETSLAALDEINEKYSNQVSPSQDALYDYDLISKASSDYASVVPQLDLTLQDDHGLAPKIFDGHLKDGTNVYIRIRHGNAQGRIATGDSAAVLYSQNLDKNGPDNFPDRKSRDRFVANMFANLKKDHPDVYEANKASDDYEGAYDDNYKRY